MIIVLASGKGGVGKTVAAMSLYTAAKRAGLPVHGVNVDPQRSFSTWQPEAAHRPDISEPEQLLCLDQPGRLLVVDTPPGTSPQAVAAWESADVLVGCTGPTSMELEGLADLAERIGGPENIDLIVVGRFDARVSQGHAVVDLARQRWGAARVVVFPARAEVATAYDERRAISPSSPVSTAASDLLARLLDLPVAQPFKEANRG